MKKRGKNKKGFTMIELMIVITVIGILAIVLLPRIAGVRDDARNSGVDANMRTVQGVVELEINRYKEKDEFKTRLENRLNDLENPVTGTTNEALYISTSPALTLEGETESTGGAVLVNIFTKKVNNISRMAVSIGGVDHRGDSLPPSTIVEIVR